MAISRRRSVCRNSQEPSTLLLHFRNVANAVELQPHGVLVLPYPFWIIMVDSPMRSYTNGSNKQQFWVGVHSGLNLVLDARNALKP